MQSSCQLMVTDVPMNTHESPGRLDFFAPSRLGVTVSSPGIGPGTQTGPLKTGLGTFCVELGRAPCTRRVHSGATAQGGLRERRGGVSPPPTQQQPPAGFAAPTGPKRAPRSQMGLWGPPPWDTPGRTLGNGPSVFFQLSVLTCGLDF